MGATKAQEVNHWTNDLKDSDHQVASYRLFVQSDLSLTVIFSAIQQLVVSSLVFILKIGTIPFEKFEKQNR